MDFAGMVKIGVLIPVFSQLLSNLRFFPPLIRNVCYNVSSYIESSYLLLKIRTLRIENYHHAAGGIHRKKKSGLSTHVPALFDV